MLNPRESLNLVAAVIVQVLTTPAVEGVVAVRDTLRVHKIHLLTSKICARSCIIIHELSKQVMRKLTIPTWHQVNLREEQIRGILNTLIAIHRFCSRRCLAVCRTLLVIPELSHKLFGVITNERCSMLLLINICIFICT